MIVTFKGISVIGTVGLTRVLTAKLSGGGQLIMMTSMFVGWFCPMTLAYLIGSAFASCAESRPAQN